MDKPAAQGRTHSLSDQVPALVMPYTWPGVVIVPRGTIAPHSKR
jgi:hypothetical protein